MFLIGFYLSFESVFNLAISQLSRRCYGNKSFCFYALFLGTTRLRDLISESVNIMVGKALS